MRFIPARAGNTHTRRAWRPPAPVHPRSRGEHEPPLPGIWAEDGSSPLARGTRRLHTVEGDIPRFIPARAGNTAVAPADRSREAVHPRSRGEHELYTRFIAPSIGSSPLARGTQPGQAIAHERHRFIPARAGNTSAAAWGSPRRTVHPRSRGEHICDTPPCSAATGSSPLARGTHTVTNLQVDPPRFIPARAGNTRVPPPPAPRTSVHPRSRGEHRNRRRFVFDVHGSSPLARGTRSPG